MRSVQEVAEKVAERIRLIFKRPSMFGEPAQVEAEIRCLHWMWAVINGTEELFSDSHADLYRGEFRGGLDAHLRGEDPLTDLATRYSVIVNHWMDISRQLKIPLDGSSNIHSSSVRQYDEEIVIAEYITRSYSSFMDDPDRSRIRVAQDSPRRLRIVHKRIRRRIERDIEFGRIEVNRCPQCNKIARTQLAKQCLWCGHDWHSR